MANIFIGVSVKTKTNIISGSMPSINLTPSGDSLCENKYFNFINLFILSISTLVYAWKTTKTYETKILLIIRK